MYLLTLKEISIFIIKVEQKLPLKSLNFNLEMTKQERSIGANFTTTVGTPLMMTLLVVKAIQDYLVTNVKQETVGDLQQL